MISELKDQRSKSISINVTNHTLCTAGFLGPVYMEGGCLGLTGLPGYPSYSGRANFSYVSFGNTSRRLHARQGSPATQGTPSTCLRHPARPVAFLPCKRFVPGLPGYPSYPGRANFSYVSFGNASKRLHARQGSPATQGTPSTCPRHPARQGSFLPCKRFVPGYLG